MSLSLLEPEVVTPPAIFTRRVVITTVIITMKWLYANGHVVTLIYQHTERREV